MPPNFPRARAFAAAFALAALSAAAAIVPAVVIAAEPTGQPTLEELLKPPSTLNVTLSRSGDYMAVTTPYKGRMNVAIIDMATRKGTLVTNFEEYDVVSVTWVGNERLVFSLGQLNAPTGMFELNSGGLFMVSRDGREQRALAPTFQESRSKNQRHRSLSFFRRIPDSEDEIIAVGNMTDADSQDLYRLNVRTGRHTLLTYGRPATYTHSWLLDSKLVPRVVTATVKDTLTQVVYYRAGEEQPWTEIARFELNDDAV